MRRRLCRLQKGIRPVARPSRKSAADRGGRANYAEGSEQEAGVAEGRTIQPLSDGIRLVTLPQSRVHLLIFASFHDVITQILEGYDGCHCALHLKALISGRREKPLGVQGGLADFSR